MPMDILTTIIPIFVVIFTGWIAMKKGAMPLEFQTPANRLVFYLAVPAMIFRAVSRADLNGNFHFTALILTLLPVIFIYFAAWSLAFLLKFKKQDTGTFIQTSMHGNLGYIGLAVAFYYLGDPGLTQAAILVGFVMILHNSLAVIALITSAPHLKRSLTTIIKKVLINPVILSSLAGVLFSFSGLSLPVILDRSLDIIGRMALPAALLLIGASLSFELMKSNLKYLFFACILKLLVMPAIGFILYKIGKVPSEISVPGIILLGSPTATVAYVMAKEMGGKEDLSVAMISISTLLSSITFFFWLRLTG